MELELDGREMDAPTTINPTATEEISKGPWTKEEDETLKRLVKDNNVAKTTTPAKKRSLRKIRINSNRPINMK